MVEVIIGIAAVLAALAAIVTSVTLLWTKIVKPLWRFFKRVGVLTETMADLPEWCESVDLSLAQLHPNGGGSLRDKVVKSSEDIEAIREMIQEHITNPELHVTSNHE